MTSPTLDFSKIASAGPEGQALEKKLQAFTRHIWITAPNTVQRLQNVCANFDNLTPEAAYQQLNPADYEEEAEEARLPALNKLVIGRNVFSILPLIATWFALFDAARAYSTDPDATIIPARANAPNSFFVLWQTGFGHRSLLTFQDTALLDVFFLALFLTFTLIVQQYEHKARVVTKQSSQEYQDIARQLMTLVATKGGIQVAPGSDPKTVADAINRAIQRALDASKQVTDDAQKALAIIQQQVQGLVTDLAAKLVAVEHQMNGLATSGNQLGSAATSLSVSATNLVNKSDQYIQAGQQIQDQISKLKTTQDGLTQSLNGISDSVAKAATDMGAATRATSALADTIHTEMGSGVKQMAANVTQAAGVLAATERALQGTTTQLDQTTQGLVQVARAMSDAVSQMDQVLRTVGVTGSKPKPLSLLDWLLNRNKHP